MAIPTSGSFSLLTVLAELGLGFTGDLITCYSSARVTGFNGIYGNYKTNTLLGFRGYNNLNLAIATSLGNGGTAATACNDFFTTPVTYYTDTGNLATATYIFNNSAALQNNLLGFSSWFSNGVIARKWDPTTDSFLGAPTTCS